MPFWLTNLAAAFFGMRLKPFVLATQLGMLPAAFAFALAGSGLDEVIARHERLRADCMAAGRSDCTMDFGAKSLLTPELMTALAMIMGMLPMALGIGEGSEQNAPLGRAVIGGLLFATVATLFFVPVFFSLVHGKRRAS